jgi:hypothetical protein
MIFIDIRTKSLYFIRGVGFASLMESVLVVQVQADLRDVSVGQLTSALQRTRLCDSHKTNLLHAQS